MSTFLGDPLDLIFIGLDYLNEILLLNRFVVGMFFAISGFHKIFVKERHQQLVETLIACGIPYVWFCQWFVPWVEFLGGLAVLSGIWARTAAVGMLIILVVALCTDGPRRIREFKPINMADIFDDLLYLSETTYAVMLVFVIVLGTGSYSLPRYIMPYVLALWP